MDITMKISYIKVIFKDLTDDEFVALVNLLKKAESSDEIFFSLPMKAILPDDEEA